MDYLWDGDKEINVNGKTHVQHHEDNADIQKTAHKNNRKKRSVKYYIYFVPLYRAEIWIPSK